MSTQDTDLIEITLETIYALDRLVRLLSGRRTNLDLARLSLSWEEDLHKSWTEFVALEQDIQHFVLRRSRLSLSTALTNLDVPLQTSDLNSSDTVSSYAASTTPTQQSTSRVQPASQMTAEIIALEASRLSLRIRALVQEAVPRTGSLLDAIIDQRQVPDGYIDEQEKLEEAAGKLLSKDSFLSDLAAQCKSADEAVRLCRAARTLAKAIEADTQEAFSERPDAAVWSRLETRMSHCLDQCRPFLIFPKDLHTMSTLEILSLLKPKPLPTSPTHADFPSQEKYNVDLEAHVAKEAIAAVKRIRLANVAIDKYKRGAQSFSQVRDSLSIIARDRARLESLIKHDFSTSWSNLAQLLVTNHQAKMLVDPAYATQGSPCATVLSSTSLATIRDLVDDLSTQHHSVLDLLRICERAGFKNAASWTEAETLVSEAQSAILRANSAAKELDFTLRVAQKAVNLATSLIAGEDEIRGAERGILASNELVSAWYDDLNRGPSHDLQSFALQESYSLPKHLEHLDESKCQLDDILDMLKKSCDSEQVDLFFRGHIDRMRGTVLDMQVSYSWLERSYSQAHSLQDAFGRHERIQSSIMDLKIQIEELGQQKNPVPPRSLDQEETLLTRWIPIEERLRIEVADFELFCCHQVPLTGAPPKQLPASANRDERVKGELNKLCLRMREGLADLRSAIESIRTKGEQRTVREGPVSSPDESEIQSQTSSLLDSDRKSHDVFELKPDPRSSFQAEARNDSFSIAVLKSHASKSQERGSYALPNDKRTRLAQSRDTSGSFRQGSKGRNSPQIDVENRIGSRSASESSSTTRHGMLRPDDSSRKNVEGQTLRSARSFSQPVTPRTHRTLPSLPNRYLANPKSRLDVAIGRVVNRLPLPVKIAQASPPPHASQRDEAKDESGLYWIGDPEPRLCFCRILRSRTVMVRVGGGWQELSQFVLQHYGHMDSVSMTPAGSPHDQMLPPSPSSGSPWTRPSSRLEHSDPLRNSVTDSTRKVKLQGLGMSPAGRVRQRVESLPSRPSSGSSLKPSGALGLPRRALSPLETPTRKSPIPYMLASFPSQSSMLFKPQSGRDLQDVGDSPEASG